MGPEQKASESRTLAFPVTITAIRPQKKRKDRFSLYQLDTFLIGISADTLVSFRLEKGQKLTRSEFTEIEHRERWIAVKDYMLRLLGRRDHSGRELEDKAVARGFDRKEAEQVRLELSEKGYLDEESFASRFVADKLAINRWGSVRIRSKLIQKGISPELADKVIRERVRNWELEEICVDLAMGRDKHFRRETDPFRRKQKIAAWLQRRGFDFSTIQRALPEILRRLDVS